MSETEKYRNRYKKNNILYKNLLLFYKKNIKYDDSIIVHKIRIHYSYFIKQNNGQSYRNSLFITSRK